MIPGRRPGPELLAVIAHHPDPRAVLAGMLPEIADHVVDLAERDPVAEALLGPEDRQEPALVIGRVGAPQAGFRDRGRPEVGIVEDRPAVARPGQGAWQVGLPDPLRQPCPTGPDSGDPLELIGHPLELANPVPFGQRGEDRLVVTAAEQLDPARADQRPDPLDELRLVPAQPVEERPRVVQGEADRRVPFDRLEHRPIGLLVDLADHPAEVADRLVVVDREGEGDPGRHAAQAAPDGARIAIPAAGR